jgi:hypothetical protein
MTQQYFQRGMVAPRRIEQLAAVFNGGHQVRGIGAYKQQQKGREKFVGAGEDDTAVLLTEPYRTISYNQTTATNMKAPTYHVAHDARHRINAQQLVQRAVAVHHLPATQEVSEP